MATMSPAQVAKELQVHRTSISRRCAAGSIRAFRLPGSKSHWRIEEVELERLRSQKS
jgi:excisionase family DNA binding protein